MSQIKFKGKVNNGRVTFYSPDYVEHHLKPFEGKEVFVGFELFKEKRSIKQNNWYYGVAIPMIQTFLLETQGEKYTKDDINQYHLNTVVKPQIEIKPIFDTACTIYKIKRTSEMNTTEFNDFKEKIQLYWANMDLFIPDPESYD